MCLHYARTNCQGHIALLLSSSYDTFDQCYYASSVEKGDCEMTELRIFVSHSHHDTPFCIRLINGLYERLDDISIFFDEDEIHAGDDWFDRLQSEVMERPIFIVVVSPDSVKAQWVKEETRLALYETIRHPGSRWLIPVRFRRATPQDLHAVLATRHFVDCSEDEESGFDKLASALQEIRNGGQLRSLPDPVRNIAQAKAVETALKNAADIDAAFQLHQWQYIVSLGDTVLAQPGNEENAELNAQIGYSCYQVASASSSDAHLQKAILLLQRATQLSPQRNDFETWLAQAYVKSGDVEQAFSIWQRALAHTNSAQRKIAILAEMFEAANANGLRERAKDWADIAVGWLSVTHLDDGFQYDWSYWAKQCDMIGYFDRALEVLDLAIARYPGNPSYSALKSEVERHKERPAPPSDIPQPAQLSAEQVESERKQALSVLQTVLRSLKSEGKLRVFPNVNTRLTQHHISYRKLGFARFLEFMRYAETHGAVRLDLGRQLVVLPGEDFDIKSMPAPKPSEGLTTEQRLRRDTLRMVDIAEKSLPYVTMDALLRRAENENLSGAIIFELSAKNILKPYKTGPIQDGSGITRNLDAVRLDRKHPEITHLYEGNPSSWAALSKEDKHLLIMTLGGLGKMYSYLTWNHLKTFLKGDDRTTNWNIALASAIDVSVIALTNREVEHRVTHKPFTVRSLNLNPAHPEVQALIPGGPSSSGSGIVGWIRGLWTRDGS
jgi:tetratricopeptide (TPR) repeat protein